MTWRRKPFASRSHLVGWARDMLLKLRRHDRERGIELVVDAAWRDGYRFANEERDAELVRALGIGRERDPGGYEAWDPRDVAGAAQRARRSRDWEALIELQRELDQVEASERRITGPRKAAKRARRAETPANLDHDQTPQLVSRG